MAKKPEVSNGPTGVAAFWFSSMTVVATVVQSFGWPGAVLASVGWFVVRYGTDEQKHEVIDKYVLGKGIDQAYPLLIVSLVAALAVWAQWYVYKKAMKLKQDEIERIGKEKSSLQSLLAGRDLQHRNKRG